MKPISLLRYVVALVSLATALCLPVSAAGAEMDTADLQASVSSSNPVSSLALLDGEILFGLGEFELTSEGRVSFNKLLAELRRFDAILSIRIIGHTDSAGPATSNLALSQRRADWIRDQFARLYPEAHIRSIGAGESAPLTSNQTVAERQRNRRVEVQVIATGSP